MENVYRPIEAAPSSIVRAPVPIAPRPASIEVEAMTIEALLLVIEPLPLSSALDICPMAPGHLFGDIR